jgi:hypothetical protein
LITAGDWLLMTWGDFVSYLVLTAAFAGLVGLLVGYRVRGRAEQAPSDCRTYGAHESRAEAEVAARHRALEQLAMRYPVAFTHLLDEALAEAGVPTVPSPARLPYANDTAEEQP